MSRRNKVAPRMLALGAVVALGAAACGGSSSKSPGASGSTAPPTGGTGAVAAAYNAAVNGVVNPSTKKGGTLNFLATSDFDSLDPARAYYAYTWNFDRMWLRGVMAFNPKPGADASKVVPDLATAPGQASSDQKTWTYHLRTGVKFQDGSTITSKDVKYAVERIFAQDVVSGGPTYLICLLDTCDKSGSPQHYHGPYKDKDPNHLGLSTVDTPDAQTIVFHLQKPFSDFDYLMAIPGSTPVPQAADLGRNGGTNYQFHVVSDGPYQIQSYSPGKNLTLVRNPNWSKASDPLRLALPDSINVKEGLDNDPMDQQLLSGAGDLEVEFTGLQPTAVAKTLRSADLKKYADDPNTGFVRYISIQEKVPPFTNIHCRRAVQYAADKVSLQFARGGPIAGGDITGTMVVPTLPSYDKSLNPYPSGPDNHGDVAKAKQELAQCGKPNGFSTKIATTNKGKGPKVAVALQAALARVGIKADIAQTDPSTYYSGFIGSPSNVHRLGLGLAVAGWGPDFPTEYGFWESIIDGRAIKTQGNSNYEELNDPAINSDIDQALAAKDANTKTQIWKDVAARVMNSADLLPFVADKTVFYHAPRLTNVYFDKAFGQYDLMNLGVTG